MRHLVIACFAVAAASSCNPSEAIVFETNDAAADTIEPVTPIVDAATCGNGNPGTGACSDPAKDCPSEDACWRFECVMGPGEIKVCGSIAKADASP